MANKRSALKAHRVSEKRRLRNRAVRSEVRTYVKKARTTLAIGVAEEATAAVVEAVRELDKAAIKNVIHKNQAARRKSRLMKRLAIVQKAPVGAPVEEAPRPRRRAAAAGTAAPRARSTRSTTKTPPTS